VRLDELGIAIHYLRGSLANDDKAHDDGLLGALIGQKVILGKSLSKLRASAAACCM
jgi:hypothetical protein